MMAQNNDAGEDVLAINDDYVQSLGRALHSGNEGLEMVPKLLQIVIKRHAWADRYVSTLKRRQRYADFLRFVTDTPPAGLGATVDLLMRLCAADPDATTMLRETTNRQGERTDLHNNIIEVHPIEQGTSRPYTLARLSAKRPDLYERVKAGDLSANAAAIEAGWRSPSMSVRLDDVAAMARALKRRLSASDLAALVAALTE